MHRRIIKKNLSSWVSCQVPPCDNIFSKYCPVLLLACYPRTCFPPIHLAPVSINLAPLSTECPRQDVVCYLGVTTGPCSHVSANKGGVPIDTGRLVTTSRLATLGRLDSKLAFHSITREQGVGWHLAISAEHLLRNFHWVT
jgi:hypothetical protein